MHLRLGVVILGCALLLPVGATAGPIVIDFESLSDSDEVTSQFAGLTFLNATALSAGISLNEFEFPPQSGQNVIFDAGSPLSIAFTTPVLSVGAYFTHTTALTLLAFDASNNLLGSANSLFANNLQLSGDAGTAPNEFIGLSSAVGISYITIAGDPFGGSFVLDDLTYETSDSAPVPVPEPSTIAQFCAVAAAYACRRFCAGSRFAGLRRRRV